MNQTPVVLQVLPALDVGGVERGTVEIATALQKEGIKNYVVSAGGRLVAELEKIGVEHIVLPVGCKNPIKIIKHSFDLKKIIQDKGITLVHVRSRAPAWAVRFACSKIGVPFIATYHGVYGLKPKWLKQVYNRVMLSGKKVIAVSDFVKQHIMANYTVAPDKVVTVCRGADTDKFDPNRVADSRIQALRQAYGVPSDKTVFILPGRRSRIKGHTLLLDAFSKMKHQDIFCLFVGSDQGRTEYTQELQSKKIPPSVQLKMVDSCADMPALYLLGDVIIGTSVVPEAFGRTVVEAQAMGKIIVAFAHGGACETIVDGQTGFLTPVGDVSALAKCLDDILAMNPEKRKQIEQNAQKSVRENFSIQVMCQKTIQIYKEISK